MILTVHKHNRLSKMAGAVDDLFVFGDDFEAIWEILEEDEALEEQFTAVASDVSRKVINFNLYFGCIKALS